MSIFPKTLLIYYAWPSVINGSSLMFSATEKAAANFAKYDYVVLGKGLENPCHPDYGNTIAILSMPELHNTTIFGYINVGAPGNTRNHSVSEVETSVREWKQLGVQGIFFDNFGYDFLVTRAQQIAAITCARNNELKVTVNAWFPIDVFGTALHNDMNPEGLPPIRGGVDFYLSESYQIIEGEYQEEVKWKTKAEALEEYRAEFKFKIFSITTNNDTNHYDQKQFDYAWYSALLYEHEATGWGEFTFSANNGIAPFRLRPIVSPDDTFISPLLVKNTRHFRRTSQSCTPPIQNSGEVWIDTETHKSGFLASGS